MTVTVHDIKVASVTADVIYAHSIKASNIQGKVVYGTSYGDTKGMDIKGQAYNTTGTLNAHDIQAGSVIAKTIYVDVINSDD